MLLPGQVLSPLQAHSIATRTECILRSKLRLTPHTSSPRAPQAGADHCRDHACKPDLVPSQHSYIILSYHAQSAVLSSCCSFAHPLRVSTHPADFRCKAISPSALATPLARQHTRIHGEKTGASHESDDHVATQAAWYGTRILCQAQSSSDDPCLQRHTQSHIRSHHHGKVRDYFNPLSHSRKPRMS